MQPTARESKITDPYYVGDVVSRNEIVTALRANPIFGVLEQPALDLLVDQGNEQHFRKAEMVFAQDEPGDRMYLIVSGGVKIYRRSNKGETIELVRRRRPDIFGELAVLDGQPRTACVETTAKTTLFSLHRNVFIGVLQHEPASVPSLICFLGSMVRHSNQLSSDLALLDLRRRLAKRLLHLAERSSTRGRLTDTERISQTDLARMVGGARQTINLVLGSFQRDGYISVGVEGIEILLPDELRSIVDS